MTYAVHLTLQSRNVKVGSIPVSTTARKTCPSDCPLFENGCYAESGPLAIMWRALSRAKPGKDYKLAAGGNGHAHTWASFISAIADLPNGQIWRHNQAGDLPGIGNAIDTVALAQLIKANTGRRGFTYTHKPVGYGGNAAAIAYANRSGFTINLSADNLQEADTLANTKAGPVVVVLPSEVQGNVKIKTPAGRKVVVCPATYRDDISCSTCQLCQRQRDVIVGFPAHGASKRKANSVAEAA